MTHLVSFIIPTYNRAYILDNALRSIFDQTYSNWEIVVIDDGSTDNTNSLVEGFHNSKIKYVYQENKGPSAARNTAFKYVTGNWVAYLDSDNEIFPEYLEVMLANIERFPDALYALPKGKRTLELYEEGRCIQLIDDSKDFLESITVQDIFMRHFHFDGNGFMHSRRIIEEGFRWDEKLRLMEEWDFVMSFAEKYPDAFVYIQDVLFHYHQRYGTDGLVSHSTYKDHADAFEYIYQKHKYDKYLSGQRWYPDRIEKYLKLQKELEEGKAPEPHLKRFSR